jgi:hypothetical protein
VRNARFTTEGTEITEINEVKIFSVCSVCSVVRSGEHMQLRGMCPVSPVLAPTRVKTYVGSGFSRTVAWSRR